MKILGGSLCLLSVVAGTATALQSQVKAVPLPKQVTYAGNVASILNERCVSCHRPGEVAPFSLIGYENAKKWSKPVANAVAKRIMPPWKAVEGYGHFEDEARLTDAEVSTLKAWASTGALAGNLAKAPAPPKFGSNWILGEPDALLSSQKPFKLGAEGEDVYRNFVLKTNYKETRWVRGFDVRPGNKKVVHHVIAFLDRGTQAQKREASNRDGQEGYTSVGGGVGFMPSGALGGWAPGVRARFPKQDIAFRLDPGATVVMQVHYHKSGKEEVDQTKLALYFAKEPPAKEIFIDWNLDLRVNIPAGEQAHKMVHKRKFSTDVTLYTTMPHMHLLGKKMKSWLEFPDGTHKDLIYVDNWDFNWQLNYWLKEPLKVPAGTTQVVEAEYDNSSSNPRNPNNPPKRVGWGEETTDEMFLLVSTYSVDRMKSLKGG